MFASRKGWVREIVSKESTQQLRHQNRTKKFWVLVAPRKNFGEKNQFDSFDAIFDARTLR